MMGLSRATLLVLSICLQISSAAFAGHAPKVVDSDVVDLLGYAQSHIDPAGDQSQNTSIAHYNRLEHFGPWMHPDSQQRCADTRELVLMRDADPKTPLTYSSDQHCHVASGLWHEPYTGTDVTNPQQLQIDHVVPLRNAYYSGAYAWRPAERCQYANFLANNFHLLAVSGHENMAKGDNGPELYLPPSAAFHCTYIGDWLKIKAIWQLSMSTAEVQAVEKTLNDEHCPNSDRFVSGTWLNQQRAAAATPSAACEEFERSPPPANTDPGSYQPTQLPDPATPSPLPLPSPSSNAELLPGEFPNGLGDPQGI